MITYLYDYYRWKHLNGNINTEKMKKEASVPSYKLIF